MKDLWISRHIRRSNGTDGIRNKALQGDFPPFCVRVTEWAGTKK